MTSASGHQQAPHRTGSLLGFKKLGKKLISGKGRENENATEIEGMGKKTNTHHLSGSRPKSSSPGNRQRSSSLFQRNKSAANMNGGHPVLSSPKSSASISNMVAHNHNPFTALHASDVLGTGTGIASPRVNGTHHSIQRKGSNNFQNHLLSNENIVYNPYGLNSPKTGGPPGSRPGTAYGSNENTDFSFYLHDGNSKIRMLPLPIADPNDYLPEEMKQVSIHLSDNFVFDSDNKPLGSGGSSEVRKVRSAYRQKDVYALKKLNMIYDETAEKFYKRCSKEFIIAKHLSRNIHVANTYYLVKVPTTTYTTRGWGFVMEICVKDLFQLMERSGWRSVPLSEKFCLFKQVAQGVKFCHDNGIAHRDLKPENVLMSRDGVCKLTDFGISDWYHVEPQNFDSPVKECEGMIGSPPYTPPEVMVYDAKKHYSESAQKPYNPLKMDSYALGMILIALVNNILPFFESCNTDARFRDYEVSYENYINHQNPHFRDKGYYKSGPGSEYSLAKSFKSPDAARVAWRLADPRPDTRYSLDDLFADPWFQAIETCVDPCDDHIFRAPAIRRTSSDNGSGFYISDQASKEDVDSDSALQHTSNPFTSAKPKPRSMVDIAQSPAVPKPDVAAKVPSSVAEEPEHAPAVEEQPELEPEQLKKGLRNLSLNNTNSSCASLKSQTSTASHTKPKTKRKRPIHNHMDITGSVNSMPSTRSFS